MMETQKFYQGPINFPMRQGNYQEEKIICLEPDKTHLRSLANATTNYQLIIAYNY